MAPTDHPPLDDPFRMPMLGPALAQTSAEPGGAAQAVQRVVKVRRDYNSWVARETMEDYALRFTPRSFRKWSELRVANTAFGAASFLVLEAVGANLVGRAVYDFAAELADQYLVMERGEVIQRGRGKDMEAEGVRARMSI
jgi:hypothetical protein